LVIKFQLGGLTHDEGILWSKHPPWFEVFSNEKIDNFIDKYLTIDQTNFTMHKYITTNEHAKKYDDQFINFTIPNH
jgi:hypothetical protein